VTADGSNTVTGDATNTISNMGDPGAAVTVLGGVVDGGSNDANWVFPKAGISGTATTTTTAA